MQWSKTSPRCRRPLQQLHGAVDRDALLVAGDQEGDRALGPAAVRGEMIERRRQAGRRSRPSCRRRRGRRARRLSMSPANGPCVHRASSPGATTSVWPANTRFGRAGADARIEVLDVVGAGLRERDALDREAGALEPIGEIGQRAAFRRRHRGTAQEITGEGDGIGGHNLQCLRVSRDEVAVCTSPRVRGEVGSRQRSG